MRRVLVTLGILALSASHLRADDLTVLTAETAGGPPRAMLSRYLKQHAFDALERRRQAFEALKTPEQFTAYQERLRKAFIEHLGGFPERTPLNARVVGALEGDGYRLEKIIYESQPRHYVTAVMFVPTKAMPPYPVVVMPCGHSPGGKVENQIAGAFLAQNGIACLTYDPIGQGERYQFLDGKGKPVLKSTTEHTLLGAGSIPVGRGTATYRIWDGIRSIDYVASRKDIDPKKIGVSGCSGGGTLTSYLMALDDRVACAAPSCYVTSLKRLLETIGPQDAEQNIHGQIAFGMDHADYLLMRAPRPTLILAATHDFFNIEGTWDAYRQAQRFYTKLGFSERVALVETDTKHGYPKAQREAMLRWMRRWLAGKDEPVTQPDLKGRPGADFICTPRGQVMLLDGARSVVDLNVERNKQLEAGRRKLWAGDRQAALAEVRRIAGIRKLSDIPMAEASKIGAIERDDHSILKIVLHPEKGIHLPALLFVPKKASGRRYLYLGSDAKAMATKSGGPLDKLVQAGHIVMAVDIRGTGETGPTADGLWGGNWFDFFTSYLLGKSMVGMRAEDVLTSARYLSRWGRDGDARGKVDVIALGVTGPPALHAAALESEIFDTLKLVRALPSWSDLVRYPTAPGQLVNTVHGALHAYDLTDLMAVLPRDKITIEEPLDLKSLATGK
jgi:dienelactone hydrolase